MKMVFKFKMSVSDYRQMLMSKMFGGPLLQRVSLLGIWVVFTVLFFCSTFHLLLLSRVVHVCALLVMVALPAALVTMELNILKYKEAYLAGFKAERQIVADEDGLTFCNCSTNESGRNVWSDVSKLEEFRHVFVIQLNHSEAVILPKRGMGNDKKIQQFRELAIEKIPKQFYRYLKPTHIYP